MVEVNGFAFRTTGSLLALGKAAMECKSVVWRVSPEEAD